MAFKLLITDAAADVAEAAFGTQAPFRSTTASPARLCGRRRLRKRWCVPLLLIALAGVLAACGGPHVFGGTAITPPSPAPELDLIDQNGQPFSLSAQRGNVALLFFGYTHCPDICPATLGTFAAARRQLGSAAEHVRFIFVTVDPDRDVPAELRAYLARVDPAIIGLTGTHAAIAQAERAYGVYSAVDRLGAATHTDRIFLIDPQGNWRILYTSDVDAAALAGDVRALLGR
jgi:protein SCO1/2